MLMDEQGFLQSVQEQQPEPRYPWMEQELVALGAQSRLRALKEARWLADGWIEREGRRQLNLASNHYLGLDPWLTEERFAKLQSECVAAGEAGIRMGSGASRLVVGHDPAHAMLERELAAYKEREAALVFSSGYMANLGVISALVGRYDAVFSDRLNHASIVDGIQLSRAQHIRYPHRDLERLEYALKRSDARRKLIVTDAVFSMDGTIAPLAELVDLKERYGALLMVDEAHSGGVYGAGGRGLCHAQEWSSRVDVVMGTFGKAFGAEGAYIAADETLVRFLVNKARTLIFSTGLPPMMAALLRQRLREVTAADAARAALLQHAKLFRARLQQAGLHTGDGESHIVPVLVGSDSAAMRISAALSEQGIAAVAIRPPTVPEGTARIRFTPMAVHRREQLLAAADQIAAAVQAELARESGDRDGS